MFSVQHPVPVRVQCSASTLPLSVVIGWHPWVVVSGRYSAALSLLGYRAIILVLFMSEQPVRIKSERSLVWPSQDKFMSLLGHFKCCYPKRREADLTQVPGNWAPGWELGLAREQSGPEPCQRGCSCVWASRGVLVGVPTTHDTSPSRSVGSTLGTADNILFCCPCLKLAPIFLGKTHQEKNPLENLYCFGAWASDSCVWSACCSMLLAKNSLSVL